MLKDNTYKAIYRNSEDDFEKDFMIPCFAESKNFDRAAGFFSLNSLMLSIDGIIRFSEAGGNMRIICSPRLSKDDITLIELGLVLNEEHVTKDLLDALNLDSPLSEADCAKMDVICNLIAEHRLTIKVAFMEDGMYHEKFGIFTDIELNKVHYIGSANETLNAMLKNMESFSVDTSWENAKDLSKIESQERHFNRLWNDELAHIDVIDFPHAVKTRMFELYKSSSSLEEAIKKYFAIQKPKSKKQLYPYQETAIQEFVDNDYHHFYEMATGTGKTFTAIRTIARLRKELNRKLFTVICVPQIDLQVQWRDALVEDGYSNIYLLGGIASGIETEKGIGNAIISYYNDNANVVVCVAVYDTFFAKIYNRLGSIDDLFVVVDEAHNLTPSYLNKLPAGAYRLGLSATIQRFDANESKNIVKYFTLGQKVPYYYGIEDAIENHFLSHYEYHAVYVHLNESEFSKYQSKTKSLALEMAKEEQEQDKERINTLSRERSLIVKQAAEKVDKLYEMTQSGYQFRNSVVYCGQGHDTEEQSIIDSVTKTLYKSRYVVSQFTSHTPDRVTVLSQFESGFFDTLVAIKCFDEGVDVPKLDKIYIMASDASLRQTVQRRGRVLRVCKQSNKEIAYIYDMVALPPKCASPLDIGASSLVRNEFLRVLEYNRLADNKDNNLEEFTDVLAKYYLDINNILEDGKEPN